MYAVRSSQPTYLMLSQSGCDSLCVATQRGSPLLLSVVLTLTKPLHPQA